MWRTAFRSRRNIFFLPDTIQRGGSTFGVIFAVGAVVVDCGCGFVSFVEDGDAPLDDGHDGYNYDDNDDDGDDVSQSTNVELEVLHFFFCSGCGGDGEVR
jgi:hypothetical protein